MTSNVGSQAIMDTSMTDSKREVAVLDALRSHFRPEFLNRIDDTVIFNALDEREIANIVKVQLRHLAERLSEKKINLTFDDSVIKFLGKAGYDPSYGARPLKELYKIRCKMSLHEKL